MKKQNKIYSIYIKRYLDIIISLIFIIILLPIYLLFVIISFLKMKGNPFFCQNRVGKNEKVFKLIKFRSMTNEKDKNGILLPDSERLTKYGKFLRKTSIDELPEFINILKGDMSIIGPRPLSVDYLPYYNDSERKRHSVYPGLTGLAQINGRNAISWEEKFKYDIEYVDKLSFFLDIKIFFLTIKKVIKKEDISDFKNEYVEIDFDEYRKKYNKNSKKKEKDD